MPTKQQATEAHKQLTELRQRIMDVQKQLTIGLHEAASFRDPDLSEQGLQKRRDELTAQVRRKAATELDTLQAHQKMAELAIRGWAEQQRPSIGDDAVRLQRASIAWDNARRLLDSGRSIHEVLAGATDEYLVLAVREWGPEWQRAATPAQRGIGLDRFEPDPTAVTRAADARLAEMRGGDVATALGMLQDLDVAQEAWNIRATQLAARSAAEPVRIGLSDMDAALAAEMVEQRTATDPGNAGMASAVAGDAA